MLRLFVEAVHQARQPSICQRQVYIDKKNTAGYCAKVENKIIYSVPKPSLSVVWTQQGSGPRTEEGKGLHKWKWRMGATWRSTPPPHVNGDMPRPYHHPVNSLQCVNDNPEQRWPQCATILFIYESEWESSVVCSHTNDTLPTDKHVPHLHVKFDVNFSTNKKWINVACASTNEKTLVNNTSSQYIQLPESAAFGNPKPSHDYRRYNL